MCTLAMISLALGANKEAPLQEKIGVIGACLMMDIMTVCSTLIFSS